MHRITCQDELFLQVIYACGLQSRGSRTVGLRKNRNHHAGLDGDTACDEVKGKQNRGDTMGITVAGDTCLMQTKPTVRY